MNDDGNGYLVSIPSLYVNNTVGNQLLNLITQGVNPTIQTLYNGALNSTQCYQCASGFFGFQGKCVTQCPLIFYKNTQLQLCLPCDSSCSQCSGPSQYNCTACPANLLIYQNLAVTSGFQCINQCPSGFYPSGNKCFQCPSTCLT